MAGPFRSLSSIGSADFGKEATLAGWAEDVRNLGGIAFLILHANEWRHLIGEGLRPFSNGRVVHAPDIL